MAENTEEKKPRIPRELGLQVDTSSFYDYFDYRLFPEANDLSFPYCVQTYDRMAEDATLAAALNAVQTIILRVPRYVESYDMTDEHIERAKFVDDCLGVTKDTNDMTHSFDDFLRGASTANKYGFSMHEKVFRVRQPRYGSKHDDGKVGIKRLPIRPQNTIESFEYDDQGRELVGIYQKQSASRTKALKNLKSTKYNNGKVFIPKNRLLHFKADSNNGKAEGVSPLSYVYSTWLDYCRYKDLEGIASSKNLNGLPVMRIPSEYMQANAEDSYVNMYKALMAQMSKIAQGVQTSIIIPSDREDDTGQGGRLFEFELLSASSSNITAITSIIERLKKEMLLCLFANELGQSLDNTKTSLLSMLVEVRIKEIFNVLNNNLIPELFEMNGWDKTKTPKLRYGKLREVPFEQFAKAIQQARATKSIPVTPANINYISEELGLPDRVAEDMDLEELLKVLGTETKDDSRSGDGYSSESGVGTADEVPEEDTSASNLSNK